MPRKKQATTRYKVKAIPTEMKTFFPMLQVGDVIEVPLGRFPKKPDMEGAPEVFMIRQLHRNTAWFLGDVAERVLEPAGEV